MIAHWFTPDEKTTIRPDRLSKMSLWHNVSFIDDIETPLSSRDLLIISFERGGSQRIKKYLYQFNTISSSSLRIVDCGMINQKNYESVIPILHEIIESGAMVVLLGPPISFMRFQVGNVRLASIVRESNLDDDIHLRNDNANTTFQYIATQRHLIAESNQQIEGHVRLSDLREDISLAEPCIRDSESMIFHCDSLSAADAGYMTGMSSSGLNAIEACQLFRYAGAAQFLSSIGIYGYAKDSDTLGITANTIAQMIWYMMEGSSLREDPDQSALSQYIVQTKDHEHTLQFFKSEISGRWWIENKSGRKVPCSYNDYRKACEEDYSAVVIKSAFG